MAIMAMFSGPITKGQYEALRKEVGWEREIAPGGVVHAASFDEAGHLHVTDVWASAELMNTFVGTRLMPAIQKLGITPPNVAVYPLHNLNVTKEVDPYRL